MPATMQEVKDLLVEQELKFRELPNEEGVVLGFGLEDSTYRDRDGDSYIHLAIRLAEEGEFLSMCAPLAYCVAECEHRAAVFEVLLLIQAKYKLLRFDYDPADGEIRPNMELPLEDSELTSNQFHRMLRGLLMGVERFDPMIRRAMTTGVASLDPPDQAPGTVLPEVQRLLDLAARAGGVNRLERLLAKAAAMDEAVSQQNDSDDSDDESDDSEDFDDFDEEDDDETEGG